MRRQAGAAAMVLVAIVALAAAGAAGYYAWQEKYELERRAAELEQARSQLVAVAAEARKAREQAEAARKELDERKAELEQLTSERNSARAFLDAEKAQGERLRSELTLLREQLAYLRTRGSAYGGVAPSVVQPRPLEVRIAPASGSRQAVRAVPAPAPAAR